MSKYLRHRPGELGLELSPGGWVEVDALLDASARRGFPIRRGELDEVAHNDKRRFAFDPSGMRIRAQQGHTVHVDLKLEPAESPEELYHGTPERSLEKILRDGLLKMRRHHVHLSPDEATARKVGTRRGRPVMLAVDAAAMLQTAGPSIAPVTACGSSHAFHPSTSPSSVEGTRRCVQVGARTS